MLATGMRIEYRNFTLAGKLISIKGKYKTICKVFINPQSKYIDVENATFVIRLKTSETSMTVLALSLMLVRTATAVFSSMILSIFLDIEYFTGK